MSENLQGYLPMSRILYVDDEPALHLR